VAREEPHGVSVLPQLPHRRRANHTAVATIREAYDIASASVLEQVRTRWTEASLDEEDEMYGQRWKRGFTLMVRIHHQTHPRGPMTVLMRQAGLAVPGVYGPAREEWVQLGMPEPVV
jgi:uncharacterized damage-inducible protein DinB